VPWTCNFYGKPSGGGSGADLVEVSRLLEPAGLARGIFHILGYF
jgi:hypothetical protein